MRRVVIIGAGAVGSTIAWTLAVRESAGEIVLIDQVVPVAKGEALDMQNAIPLAGSVCIRQGNYEDCADADCIILTAGRSRHDGESRVDLLDGNRVILLNVLKKLEPYYNGCYILLISNPVDVLTYLTAQYFPKYFSRILGTGTILDSARLRYHLSKYLRISSEAIEAYVIGEHGKYQMPLWSIAKINQIPIEEYCNKNRIQWDNSVIQTVAAKVQLMGQQIINKKGRTQYGVSSCVAYLIDLLNEKRKTPVCVSHLIQNQYGIISIALSTPVYLTSNGIKDIPISFEDQYDEWINLSISLQNQWSDLKL